MLFIRLIVILFCVVISTTVSAQYKEVKIKFGEIKAEDFKPQVYSIDSSAEAVYLYDIGSMKYGRNNEGWFSLNFKVHRRIRLLSKKSFQELATVAIPLFGRYASGKEELNDFEAATYNLEDGKVIQTRVDKSSILEENEKYYEIKKFTFPALKEGSIIEYSYTTESPYYGKLPAWFFQNNYPKLWSQFIVERPEFFELITFRQGFLNSVIDTTVINSAYFDIQAPGGLKHNYYSKTIRNTWAYKDVPALKEESYITSMRNYVQKIELEFSAVRLPGITPTIFMNNWYETTDKLMKEEDFGSELNKDNNWLKDDVKKAIVGVTDDEAKAKKIYEFVRDNYRCINNSSVYLSQPLRKTAQLKKGNVADINMLLIAMLHYAGYFADPVLLSTREHGKTYELYPILDKFNYLIVRLNMNDNKSYLLDAANPVLGFGNLDEACYNGNARVIAAMPGLIGLSADSLHESEVISLFLSNGEKGEFAGTYKDVMGEMQSEDLREKIRKSSIDEYLRSIKKSFSSDFKITDETIDSLNQPENPVSIQYDVSLKPEDDIVYFSPVTGGGEYNENPFKSEKRSFPVEMPYCIDKTYILSMEVPAGYKVDELPKPARIILNENDGMFEYLIQQSDDNIELRCRTKLNKATFEPDDYETLRNFFAYIVKKESEQIVFKKQ